MLLPGANIAMTCIVFFKSINCQYYRVDVVAKYIAYIVVTLCLLQDVTINAKCSQEAASYLFCVKQIFNYNF